MANRAGPHSALLKACEDYIALQGGWTLRIAGGVGQRRGSPDMTCFIPADIGWPIGFFVEGKTGKAVQSDKQREVQAEIDAHHGIYLVVHSLDELEDMLLALGLVRHRLTDRQAG